MNQRSLFIAGALFCAGVDGENTTLANNLSLQQLAKGPDIAQRLQTLDGFTGALGGIPV
jgi:hypothetical protein